MAWIKKWFGWVLNEEGWVAIPIIAAVVSIAGTVYYAVSSSQAGEKAEHAEERQAAVLAEQAGVREEQQRENSKRLLATQKSRIGASGITMEGSPLLNQMETQAQFEKDLLNIRRGTQWELSETLSRGQAYKEAGNVRAGTTLLTGLGKTAGTMYGYGQQQGWFTPQVQKPIPLTGYDEFGSSYRID